MRKARPKREVNPLQAKLGDEIHRLRVEAGMTQDQLAPRCDLSRGYLSRIEKGHVNVTLGTLAKIAAIFDLTLTVSLRRSRKPKP